VREDVGLAFTLLGVGEVAEDLADEGAVHLALVVAHLLEADGDTGLAQTELELLGHGQDGLAAGGAGVLHRLDGFGGEPRDRGGMRPEARPCWLNGELQVAPMVPTSRAAASAEIVP
jgi:hypothetical protein